MDLQQRWRYALHEAGDLRVELADLGGERSATLEAAASRDPAFLDRLHQATVRYDSPAAARRVGLIIERLFGPGPATRYLGLLGQNRAAVLLRPGAPVQGSVDKTWRVRLNVSLSGGRILA